MQVTNHVAHDRRLRSGRAEIDDIAGHHDDMEHVVVEHVVVEIFVFPAERDRAQVADQPFDRRRLGSRPLDHVGVEIDSGHDVSTPFEFDRQAPRAASGVEDRTSLIRCQIFVDEPRHRVGFSVHGLTPRLHRLPSLVVLLEIDGAAPFDPTLRHSGSG